jgi:serralysin
MPITLPQPITFGDTSGDLRDHIEAEAQTLSGSGTLVGDANALLDHAVGGNDTLTGIPLAPGGIPNSGSSVVIGDAITITDHALGGNDQISGPTPTVYGDAITLSGHAQGGNDNISTFFSQPLVGASGVAYGDADVITDHARGGNDTVMAAIAYGDAATITGFGQGGDDHVTVIGSPASVGYGDAYTSPIMVAAGMMS